MEASFIKIQHSNKKISINKFKKYIDLFIFLYIIAKEEEYRLKKYITYRLYLQILSNVKQITALVYF